MDEITTIKLRKRTRDALKMMGRKGESYENIIIRLLLFHIESPRIESRAEDLKFIEELAIASGVKP